jgi:hydroxymethylbilane synthase
VRDVPLVQLGGEGAFTKAIQQALLDGHIDIAVHSLKDLPTFAVPGLVLAAVPPRGPTGDALVSVKHCSFDALPAGAVVATSSLRRKAQLLHRRPDLKMVDIRGNVETRLRKLTEQSFDATILAEAGLHRLGMADRITEVLDNDWMLPAVGQGAIGIECRADDEPVRAILASIDHLSTRCSAEAERAMLRELGGGCSVPIGAHSSLADSTLMLRGAVLSPDGARRIDATIRGLMGEAARLGQELARQLCAQGAEELLAK